MFIVAMNCTTVTSYLITKAMIDTSVVIIKCLIACDILFKYLLIILIYLIFVYIYMLCVAKIIVRHMLPYRY